MNSVGYVLGFLLLFCLAQGFIFGDCEKEHHCSGHGRWYHCQCHCNDGWEGHNCESAKQSSGQTNSHGGCRHTNCHNGDCKRDGLFESCTCHDGYYGYHCETESPCHTSHPCKNGGSCHLDFSKNEHYSCTCAPGFTGQTCEVQTNSHGGCSHINCHHGDCKVDGVHGKCTCHDGYYGSHCNYESPCRKSTPCKNGGSCQLDTSSTHHYSCTCASGFTGRTCEDIVHKVDPHTVTATTTLKIVTTKSTTPLPKTTTHFVSTTQSTMRATTTTQSTDAPTNPATHSTSVPTTEKPLVCDPLKTITDLSVHTVSSNANASQCLSGENKDSDAFVMNHCKVDVPMLWRQGRNVYANCLEIPLYTPIATFDHGRFHAQTGTAAIFTGCIANGIRVGLQTCDKGVRIEHFDANETDYQNAKKYYLIQ